MYKPQNHVTKRYASLIEPQGFTGSISTTLLKQLQEAYPPRCKSLGESDEAHQRYAGKVELINLLSDLHAQGADLSDEDILAEDAERAT